MWYNSSVTSLLEYLFVSKRYPTADTTVLLAKNYFKIAQKVAKSLDSFCNKICSQDLPKIAQSGRTVHQSKWKCFRFLSIFGEFSFFCSKPETGLYGLKQIVVKEEIISFQNKEKRFQREVPQTQILYGRVPWSSGYGKRLTFRRSWVWIPGHCRYTGWPFFHISLL